jgi:hypothetical protein
MRRYVVIFSLMVLLAGTSAAQTETPVPTATHTPTPTLTPTPAPYVYATIQPEATDEPGVMTRFDYTATAGDVHIANLLTAILLSLWAFFLFGVIVLSVFWSRK